MRIIRIVDIGVLAFMMPANPDVTCRSANANRALGMEFMKSETQKM